MSHTKPLFIPWLREQIDSGTYPGVSWINPEKTIFCIPWKHALRQDAASHDVLIFKAWAIISGNGRPQGDPSVWKRNFRSTLRVKGFTMLSDNKNDTANPHKIYQWPDESKTAVRARSSAGSQECEGADLGDNSPFPTQESQGVSSVQPSAYLMEDQMFTDSTLDQDLLQECLKGLNLSPVSEGSAIFEPPPEQQLQNHLVIGGNPSPGQQPHPVAFEGADSGVVSPGQPAQPIGGAVGGACDQQMVVQIPGAACKTVDSNQPKTHFRVKVFYRGEKVLEHLVENEAGFRLVYRPDLVAPILDPHSGYTLVPLPSPTHVLDQTQARLTQRLLEVLGEVEVGTSGPMVYGQRRGECKAFWGYDKFEKNKPPQEVSKLPNQPLYYFKDFVQALINFTQSGGEAPPVSLFLCLGEKWPDPGNKPWQKKLISVEVVLTLMESLKEASLRCGASSMSDSVSLQLSLQLSLQEMMDTW